MLVVAAACSDTEKPLVTSDTTTSPTRARSTTEPTSSSGETVAIELEETGRFGVAFLCVTGCPRASVDEQRVGPLFVRLESFGATHLERISIKLTNEGDQLLQGVTATDSIDFAGVFRRPPSSSTPSRPPSGSTSDPTAPPDEPPPARGQPVTKIEDLVSRSSTTMGTCTVRQTGPREGAVACTVGAVPSGRTATVDIVFSRDRDLAGTVVNRVSARARD